MGADHYYEHIHAFLIDRDCVMHSVRTDTKKIVVENSGASVSILCISIKLSTRSQSSRGDGSGDAITVESAFHAAVIDSVVDILVAIFSTTCCLNDLLLSTGHFLVTSFSPDFFTEAKAA